MKKSIALILAMLLLFSAAGLSACAKTQSPAAAPEEPAQEAFKFADWNKDAPALNALIEYVEAVTDEGSADCIPVEDPAAQQGGLRRIKNTIMRRLNEWGFWSR